MPIVVVLAVGALVFLLFKPRSAAAADGTAKPKVPAQRAPSPTTVTGRAPAPAPAAPRPAAISTFATSTNTAARPTPTGYVDGTFNRTESKRWTDPSAENSTESGGGYASPTCVSQPWLAQCRSYGSAPAPAVVSGTVGASSQEEAERRSLSDFGSGAVSTIVDSYYPPPAESFDPDFAPPPISPDYGAPPPAEPAYQGAPPPSGDQYSYPSEYGIAPVFYDTSYADWLAQQRWSDNPQENAELLSRASF